MTKMTTLILTTTLAAASQLSQAAQSTPISGADSPKQMLVRYADLDLARSTGASALLHRIQRASEIVCSPLESKDPARQVMFQHCVSDAMARAVTQVDRPALNAYYRGTSDARMGGPIEVASTNPGLAR